MFREGGTLPVAGATVSLSRETVPRQREGAGESTTDETGFFLFADLKPGRYHLDLSRSGSIEGVVSRPDGAPLAGAGSTVTYSAAGGPGTRNEGVLPLRIEAKGRYVLADLPAGTYRLSFRVPGYPPVIRENVVVSAGRATLGTDVRLPAVLSLRGKVLRPDGTPAGGATISIRQDRDGQPVRTTAAAGKDGTFIVAGLPPGGGALRASLPGVPVEVMAGKKARVELEVVAGGTLSAAVAGAPAAAEGMFVSIIRGDSWQVSGTVVTAAGGTLNVSGLAPGDYLAMAWPRDVAGILAPFTIRAGQATELALPWRQGVALRGRVAGTLPKNACISAESDTGFGAARLADNGTFVLAHLLPGTYTLRAWAPGEVKIVALAGVRVGDAGAEGVAMEWK